MEVKNKMEIEIKKIFVKDNIRTRIDESDVSDLMADIRQKGMLQPVGVKKEGEKFELLYGNRRLAACTKLGHSKIEAKIFDTDLTKVQKIAINAAENIHREDVSPYEFARVVNNLMKEGLNKVEASIILSVSVMKIDTALRIFERVPEIDGIHTGYVPAGRGRTGLVSASVLDAVATLRLSPVKTKAILKSAHTGDMSTSDVRLIGRLLNDGMDIEEAVKEKDNYMSKVAGVVVRKEAYLTSGITDFRAYVKGVLQGKIQPIKNLVY